MASPAPTALPPAPNPLTSLAWLPADIASQYELERYLTACTVGAWLWDVLMSLFTDIQMFRRNGRLGLSDFAYILSRLLSGGFVVGIFIFMIAPLPQCEVAIKVVTWLVAFALPCNSFLFFIRARGVFYRNPYIVWGFFALWLTTFASITTPFAFSATKLGPTRWCINDVVKGFSAASFVVIFVFDTSVFLAISLKVSTYSMADDWRGRLKSFATGNGMGHVSRALLKTGQIYYMVTVSVNLVAMVLLLTPSLSLVHQGMFTVPNVALQNAMACRVFRLLKLGIISDSPTAPTHSSFGRTAVSTLQFPGTRTDISEHDNIGLHTITSTKGGQGPIRITVREETASDAKDLDDFKDSPSSTTGSYAV